MKRTLRHTRPLACSLCIPSLQQKKLLFCKYYSKPITWIPPDKEEDRDPKKRFKFIDSIRVVVRSGPGGNGGISFDRQRNKRVGVPDGGNGGHGGSVYIEPVQSLPQNLSGIKKRYAAEPGGSGGKSNMYGKSGPDIVIQIPVGTTVSEISEDQAEVNLIYDFADFNTFTSNKKLLCAGGKGGFGNAMFKSGSNRSPKTSTPGTPGDAKHIYLELKTIADVGLVGWPNAGKSTLLSLVSNARPKIANYPFTTLQPNVGVIGFTDHTQISVADIPGIVEGAHVNKGLGLKFLRHIERTKVLCYVLDMANGDPASLIDGFNIILSEVEHYKRGLTSKPAILIANKMDLPGALSNLRIVVDKITETGIELPIFPLSAVTKDGVEDIVMYLKQVVEGVKNAELQALIAQAEKLAQEKKAITQDLSPSTPNT
eukprot:TRINITY_DN1659_c0_g1_i2.p1 TRINITY_DN1659_c0_g1~~TRINITY_DN1659_c0_g1_i2.p1  ORF type:complete len:427 (+),score=70.70 TRINITY_DN1659_c0_g1_i2:96-1376(+)